jgi:hypothetical protein
MEDWLFIQNFYHGLTNMAPDHIDAGGGGALISSCLNVNEAKNLIEKMVSNQG